MALSRDKLKIGLNRLEEINDLITDPGNVMINQLLEVVEKYGGPEEINRKAAEARKLENLMARLKEIDSPYLAGVEWLAEQKDKKAFVSMADYRARVAPKVKEFNEANAVTLEISALQFFPWLIEQAKQTIEKKELLPGRFIRVRNMAEQTKDQGDTLAVAAAMQIVGSSYVETLDTKGTDGSNIHLGGPENHHRLLRRHRSAQRPSHQVGRRIPQLLHHLRHQAGPQHQPRDCLCRLHAP